MSPTPLSDHEKQLLAQWVRHPGAEVARREILAHRNMEATRMGNEVFKNPSGFDPHAAALSVAEYVGALKLLNNALFVAKAVERETEKRNEADSS